MDRTLPRPRSVLLSRKTLLSLFQLLRLWHQRSRTRHQLAALDARLLADAGISPSERLAELQKPFWR